MEGQTFGFILDYDNTYCEVICDEGHFMIYFNGVYECEIEKDEDCNWVQADGNLVSEAIITEIGQRIELHYM